MHFSFFHVASTFRCLFGRSGGGGGGGNIRIYGDGNIPVHSKCVHASMGE